MSAFRSRPWERHVARGVDAALCGFMNTIQRRHRLHSNSRSEFELYVNECEGLAPNEYFPSPSDDCAANPDDAVWNWTTPLPSPFPRNNTMHVDLFKCERGWTAPTVIMLHALMSASDAGYRRLAREFNLLGWNACFVHLPYHYSRRPRRFLNGELAISADLVRNAEGLRQGVSELRQLMAKLRALGCREFGLWGTSYGGWIGGLASFVERDFRFIALMAPIVDVEHAIWQSPVASSLRREVERNGIDRSLVRRYLPLSSPLHNLPLCGADRVVLAAGTYDRIVLPEHVEELHAKWTGSQMLLIPQGHFGFRMMPETLRHLKAQGVF